MGIYSATSATNHLPTVECANKYSEIALCLLQSLTQSRLRSSSQHHRQLLHIHIINRQHQSSHNKQTRSYFTQTQRQFIYISASTSHNTLNNNTHILKTNLISRPALFPCMPPSVPSQIPSHPIPPISNSYTGVYSYYPFQSLAGQTNSYIKLLPQKSVYNRSSP